MFIESTEELAQNKLLLLYLIDISDYDLNKNNITEFILEHDYMNYFLIQQYLSELLNSSFITLSDETDGIYSITDKGKIALSYFKDRIPEEFKDHVNKKFIKSLERLKLEREVLSEFYQKENEQYVVNLKLVEGEEILFSMYLDVVDRRQAEKISDRWKNNTEEIYQKILSAFISDQDE